MASIQEAESQAGGFQAALNASSSAMQRIGNIESLESGADAGCRLAHAMNAIGQLITLVDGLQAEVDDLTRKQRR